MLRLMLAGLVVSACSSAPNGETSRAGAAGGGAGVVALESAAMSGVGTGSDEQARFVPSALVVTALAGGNGVLEVTALTVQKGSNHTEIFVALQNRGGVPACSAAVSVELFDEGEQSLGIGITGLLTQHFYRLRDGSDAFAACVGPGDVTMAAVTDLPSDIDLERVRTVVYRCPYFALDAIPSGEIAIRHLKGVADSAGTAYTGTLVNGLDVALTNPSVTIFAVNRVGRPLGATTVVGAGAISPGASWTFETRRTGAQGVDQVAFPAGALAN